MKTAYCIDKESLGGGCEFIRRQSAECRLRQDECRTFYSDQGECTPKNVDSWGADEIVVNHLKALVQLLGNPFRRPKGRITFVVHGVHLRKYDWMIRESNCFTKAVMPWVKRLMRRILESWLYHRCDRLIALTPTDRDDILRLYGRKLKVEIEPNTLDGWTPDMADGLPPGVVGPFKYICIGRFDYQKGQDRWIRVLSEEGEGRTLYVGDGPTLASCQVLARQLGVADRCVFAGAIPNAERYLRCAEIVVSPSRWEGMPYLMMKARVLGCRILATDCPGNRDVLTGYEKWDLLKV